MKKILSLLIYLILTGVSFGQVSEMLVDTNKTWSNLFSTYTGGPPPYYMTTTFVKFSGDTVINSAHYKKVLSSQDSLQNNYFVTGYIYEDSTGKVFYQTLNDTTIRMLYDFNVEVGDTVDIDSFFLPLELIVDTIDSVFIYNRYLKRIVLSNVNCPFEEWIEGIGSLCGVLNVGCSGVVGTIDELLCYYENDTLKYSNPAYPHCYYNTVGLDNPVQSTTEVSLFPDPVNSTSTLLLKNMPGKGFNLDIFDLMGKKIKSINISDNRVLINRNDFDPGIYFYRVTVTPSEVFLGKFIVK